MLLPEEMVTLTDDKYVTDLNKLMSHLGGKEIILLPQNEFICSRLYIETVMSEFKKKSEYMAK